MAADEEEVDAVDVLGAQVVPELDPVPIGKVVEPDGLDGRILLERHLDVWEVGADIGNIEVQIIFRDDYHGSIVAQ